MSVNRGFPPTSPTANPDSDYHIDGREVVMCGKCKRTVPAGKAHIVVHPAGPNMHVMFCPEHCPCQA